MVTAGSGSSSSSSPVGTVAASGVLVAAFEPVERVRFGFGSYGRASPVELDTCGGDGAPTLRSTTSPTSHPPAIER